MAGNYEDFQPLFYEMRSEAVTFIDHTAFFGYTFFG